MQQGGGTLHLGETPIGPTWDPHHYFLGADDLGRDVAALLLYGGRSSLQIGIGSAVICCVIATVIALIAGFFGGLMDAMLSRLMDIIWAFPVYLLAISISTELLTHSNGVQVGPLHIERHQPLAARRSSSRSSTCRTSTGRSAARCSRWSNKEFVEAAIAQGASNLRLIFSEILPNVVSTVIVLLPLMIATTILTESALSFLSIGVQPPNVSWGTIISDGQDLLYTRPWVSIAPGIMIVLTVLALNVLGDGVRDALDPRAKLRVEKADHVLTFIVRRVAVDRAGHVRDHGRWSSSSSSRPRASTRPGAIAGRNSSPQILAEIRAQFGLNRPLPVQYGLMMKRLFITRNLVSYSNQGHAGGAGDRRRRRPPRSRWCSAPRSSGSWWPSSWAWPRRVLRGTLLDPLLMIIALIGISTPVFWLGAGGQPDLPGRAAQHASCSAGCRRSGTRRSRRARCCGSRA